LWSKSADAWVSRSTNNHYSAQRVIDVLGFENTGRTGERLSYAEQIERKAERAEERADRYETHAENAEKRAENLQSEFNHFHGDIAFFTQPNINSSSGRSFTNYRNKVYARFEKGMEEYRKSDYFKERAATARATAENAKLKDAIYLDNKIKECKKNIKAHQKNIDECTERIERIEKGEVIKRYNGEPITADEYDEYIDNSLEKIEIETDKLAFFENCLDEIGGIQFSQENIKVGYVVDMKRSGKCEIVGAGPINVKYKILEGGAKGMVLTEAYAGINKIIAVKEAEKVDNPFSENDILCAYRPADNSVYRAFQVLKITEKSVQIQEINVIKCIPQIGQFKIGSKPERKGIAKSKFSDYVGVYCDNWQLHKYTAQN
jgi:chaperonin cofactor prefoldin